MRCPRCGDDNLPGLPRCFSCAASLTEPLPPPPTQLPRVRALNPLAQKTRPPFGISASSLSPSSLLSVIQRLPLPSAGGLRSSAAGFGGALMGLIPGLPAWRAGRPGLAVAAALALLLALLLVLVTWRHASSPQAMSLVWILLFASACTGAWLELRLAPAWRIVATLSAALTVIFGLRTLSLVIQGAFFTELNVDGVGQLAGGALLLRDVEIEELVTGDLVAVEQGGGQRFEGYGQVVVGPILALPGQTLSDCEGGWCVDGEPVEVPPLNPAARLPRVGQPLLVPTGSVVLLAAPIQAVPEDHLIGRVWYRWSPVEQRGPVVWPPSHPLPTVPTQAPGGR